MTQTSMTHPISQSILRGASNFRDIGGYKTVSGARVRHGRVYRSDHLGGLTQSDLAILQSLPLTHSIDFRGVVERGAQQYEIPGTTVVSLPIEPTAAKKVLQLVENGYQPADSEVVEIMCETYRGYVHDQAATFGQFFRILLTHTTPIVFHCTAGKDRTGFAAALLLSAMGVDRDTVMEDYLLSNTLYRRDPALEGQGPSNVLSVLWQVQPAFLQAAFDAVDSRFGGVSQYLTGHVGMTGQELDQLWDALLVK